MEKGVLLFSGGLLSTLVLNMLLEDRKDIHCIYIKMGYKYEEVELDYAKKVIEYLEDFYTISITFKVIDLTNLNPNELKSYSSEKEIALPLRRLTLSTIGALYANEQKINTVYLGNGESSEYPDGSFNYMIETQNLISQGLPNPDFELNLPFFDLDREDIIDHFMDNNLISYVFSCINPRNDQPCGQCYKCLDLEIVKKNLS